MPLAGELLELARQIVYLEHEDGHQASCRRAISTAYYALFHLLVSEATSNWKRVELRPVLGRIFEHGNMRSASSSLVSKHKELLKKNPPESAELTIARHLHIVADSFVQAQEARNAADYDTSVRMSRAKALEQIDAVSGAFGSWKAVRDEPVAQAYLVALLARKR